MQWILGNQFCNLNNYNGGDVIIFVILAKKNGAFVSINMPRNKTALFCMRLCN